MINYFYKILQSRCYNLEPETAKEYLKYKAKSKEYIRKEFHKSLTVKRSISSKLFVNQEILAEVTNRLGTYIRQNKPKEKSVTIDIGELYIKPTEDKWEITARWFYVGPKKLIDKIVLK